MNWNFNLSVHHKDGPYTVTIWEGDDWRAETCCDDLDTALKMALPYIATCCEDGPIERELAKLGWRVNAANQWVPDWDGGKS